MHIHSRYSRSQILYWLSLQSIHLPVCVLRCPAVFLHILKFWYRHITAIMWLYNALKLKKTHSFTVFSTFSSYSKCPAVFCGVPRFSVIPSADSAEFAEEKSINFNVLSLHALFYPLSPYKSYSTPITLVK